MASCVETCDLEPFVSEVTPQLDDPSSIEIFQQQIQGYLDRFREAVCADMQCLGSQTFFSDVYQNIVVSRRTVDIPNIGSNGSTTVDIPAPNTPLGTHVISWAPTTDATDIDDLIITFLNVTTDFIRGVFANPTPGAVNPGLIDFEFVCGQVNPDL